MGKHLVLGFDSDLLAAADAGELYRVEDSVAHKLGRKDIPTIDNNYGSTWILVRATGGQEALDIAKAYDASDIRLRIGDGGGEHGWFGAIFAEHRTVRPVETDGWYEHEDGTWGEYSWGGDPHLPRLLRVADGPETAEEKAARIQREEAEYRASRATQ